MTPLLEQAVKDLCLPAGGNLVLLTEKPTRWDEYLDLNIPILISHTCGDFNLVMKELCLSGLGPQALVRLVLNDGTVQTLASRNVDSTPELPSSDWVLSLNWSHPNEGWRSERPLSGKRYVVTRAEDKAKELGEKLSLAGGSVLYAPMIAFEALPSKPDSEEVLDQIEECDWIVFTSAKGVEFFFHFLKELGHGLELLNKKKMACIGPTTERCLETFGVTSQLTAKKSVAEGLLKGLANHLGETIAESKFVLPRALVARDVLPDGLRERGAQVLTLPLYQTVAVSAPEAWDKFVDQETRILFTSSSTAQNWMAATQGQGQPCFCIGPVTAKTAEESGMRVLAVAENHDLAGLLKTIFEADSRKAQ